MSEDATTGEGNGCGDGRRAPEQPRLMITKIVCTNFKSYAGVKELGPFHKVYTLYATYTLLMCILYTTETRMTSLVALSVLSL